MPDYNYPAASVYREAQRVLKGLRDTSTTTSPWLIYGGLAVVGWIAYEVWARKDRRKFMR